ncbi:hypothetical protein E3U23_13795 [Erythrobacter litoralis]|uniref:thermonuclease family protein n=1 Tax=Erythrobacter litoralis TaxID=39960 RepID=UPI00243509FD|nr:hypothetical protein [Erythrobacter litoralis]MDG6080261.1 hypothetical protein [Erythrobacter litoralis]
MSKEFTMGLAATAMLICTPIAVWDDDGPIRCEEGPKIRLAGIAVREIDGTCRPHHPCPDAPGIEARNALVRLLGGAKGQWKSGHIVVSTKPMRCGQVGRSYGRVVATCRLADGRDLSAAMLRTGTVLRWK